MWKEDTRVPGTQFELGSRPFQRNSEADWDQIRQLAQRGELDLVPGDIYVRYETSNVRYYRSLTAIASDHSRAVGNEKEVVVFYGRTGSGKSRRAWDEAGLEAYAKDPRSKWWDGYRGEENVIIDEFRGTIDISHILRWFDRYPVRVERKGSSVPLGAKKFWITSNIGPDEWYPGLDSATLDALKRRLTNITFFE